MYVRNDSIIYQASFECLQHSLDSQVYTIKKIIIHNWNMSYVLYTALPDLLHYVFMKYNSRRWLKISVSILSMAEEDIYRSQPCDDFKPIFVNQIPHIALIITFKK